MAGLPEHEDLSAEIEKRNAQRKAKNSAVERELSASSAAQEKEYGSVQSQLSPSEDRLLAGWSGEAGFKGRTAATSDQAALAQDSANFISHSARKNRGAAEASRNLVHDALKRGVKATAGMEIPCSTPGCGRTHEHGGGANVITNCAQAGETCTNAPKAEDFRRPRG